MPRTGARRYAQAVWDLASSDGKVQAWHDDLQLMAGVFEEPQVLAYFQNPRGSDENKQEAVRRMFEGRVQPEAINLLRLLIDRDRIGILPALLDRYEELVRESLGIVVANVTTAIELDDEEKRRIGEQLSLLTGKRVQLNTDVEPEIIGGVVAQIGDKLIDGSVRTALQELRQRLV